MLSTLEKSFSFIFTLHLFCVFQLLVGAAGVTRVKPVSEKALRFELVWTHKKKGSFECFSRFTFNSLLKQKLSPRKKAVAKFCWSMWVWCRDWIDWEVVSTVLSRTSTIVNDFMFVNNDKHYDSLICGEKITIYHNIALVLKNNSRKFQIMNISECSFLPHP